VGLEPHTFYYPGRCPKPVRLEETSNPHLASECIITDANTFPFRTAQRCLMHSHRERAMTHVQEGVYCCPTSPPLLALICIERDEQRCHGFYVTEREKDDPSRDSNYTSSTIRADVLSHLD
jgi:hypothetical protein